MADPSGSGEPVPAPMHCCLRCGWEPIEGMTRYREIHGDEAKCIRCRESLVGQVDPYAASPGGEPPTPRATQEALEALDRLGYLTENLLDPSQAEADLLTVRAALGSARPPVPPQVAYVIAGRCLSTQHNQEPCDCAPSGFGEPSREPTLEEVVRETIAEHYRTWRGWKGAQGTAPFNEESMTDLTEKVRARLSEAPR